MHTTPTVRPRRDTSGDIKSLRDTTRPNGNAQEPRRQTAGGHVKQLENEDGDVEEGHLAVGEDAEC